MDKNILQLSAVILVCVLISAGIITSISLEKRARGYSDEIYYELENFESYDGFTEYLQGNYDNSARTFWLGSSDQSLALGKIDDMDGIVVPMEESSGGESVDYSETNIQVAGVDEPDIVKTDGLYLYIVSNNKVIIVKAFPAEEADIISEIIFNDTLTIENLFISNKRLVVFAQTYHQPILMKTEMMVDEDSSFDWYSSPDTYIKIYDLENIAEPAMIKEIVVGGSFSAARLIGDYIYVITTQYSYDVGYYLDEDEYVIPRLLVDDEVNEVALSDIFYVDLPEKSNTVTNILSVNIHDESEEIQEKIFLLGNGQTLYVSKNNIYVTYSTQYYDYDFLYEILDEMLIPLLPEEITSQLEIVKTLTLEDYQKETITQWILQNYVSTMDQETLNNIAQQVSKRTERTIIHRISISNGQIEYIAQGDVPGFVNNQFSLSEYNQNLRISTTLQGWMLRGYFSNIESQNNVYILDMNLDIVGSVEDLASGEQIYATRFIGDTCYLVTYRQIDPFFVIDLSDPTNPEVLGELKIPGFSTYLHPYDDNHIIGIGRNGSNVKISLFDVTDTSNPLELSNYEIINSNNEWGWSESTALYEHKAFLFDKEKNLLVIPAGIYYKQSAYVFDVSVEQGIVFRDNISHDCEEAEQQNDKWYYYYDCGNSIKRTLYIDDVLYTISDNMVKMNELESLTVKNSVILV